MIATCTGSLSKNLKAGQLLGKGVGADRLTDHMPTLPEGVNTMQSLHELIQKHSLQLPLSSGLHQVVFGQKSLAMLLASLPA